MDSKEFKMLSPIDEHAESKMHLDAMLYILEDPSLDRKSFEEQLAENCELAEILAEAVATYHAARCVSMRKEFSGECTESNTTTTQPHFDNRSNRLVSMLSTLAASLALVSYLGFQAFQSRDADVLSLNNVVLAWSEMQSEPPRLQQSRELVEFDSEGTLAVADTMSDVDVPDWMVLATADSFESEFNFLESRGLLQ